MHSDWTKTFHDQSPSIVRELRVPATGEPERVSFPPSVRCERGAVHIVGGILLILSVMSTFALFGDRYRFSMLEEQIAEQEARIDDLEARLRGLTLGVR